MNKILYLGTSHTQCECQRGEDRFLKIEDTWVHHLSNMLGKDFTRLSRGGIDNYELGVVFNSFRNNKPELFAEHKTIIAEVRWGTEWIPFPAEIFDIEHWANPEGLAYELAEDFGGKESHINLVHYPWNTCQDQLLDRVKDKDDKLILESMFPTMELYMKSAAVLARIIYNTSMLYELSKLLDMDFYWFSVSKNQFGKDRWGNISYNLEDKNYTVLLESLQNEYKDLFSLNLCPDGINDTLNYRFDQNTCECGHHDETKQMHIAEFLFDAIQKQRKMRV